MTGFGRKYPRALGVAPPKSQPVYKPDTESSSCMAINANILKIPGLAPCRRAASFSKSPRYLTIIGDPGWIRTTDPQIRNLMLYPAELRDH